MKRIADLGSGLTESISIFILYRLMSLVSDNLNLLVYQTGKKNCWMHLFEPEIRSYDRGLFVYDALIDGAYVYSFLDSAIARLRQLKIATEDFDSQTRAEVICFPHQLNFLKRYLGSAVTFRLLDLSIVEERFGIK